MTMNAKSGSRVRRAFRRSLRSVMATISVDAGLNTSSVIPLTQMVFLNSSPGVLKIRRVGIWLEAQDATETVTLYRAPTGTAIEDGDAILASAFSLASATNALDTAHYPTLSTSVHHNVKPSDALGIVLSAGTDTATFVMTIDLIPA